MRDCSVEKSGCVTREWAAVTRSRRPRWCCGFTRRLPGCTSAQASSNRGTNKDDQGQTTLFLVEIFPSLRPVETAHPGKSRSPLRRKPGICREAFLGPLLCQQPEALAIARRRGL